MRKNAFGDLRFSGRDPIEVVDELRAQWADIGPIIDDDDRVLAAKFEDTCARVLEAAGGARPAREEREPRGERGRRRGRRSAEQPVTSTEPRAEAAPVAPVPSSDAITQPAKFEPVTAPPVPAPPIVAEATPPAEPARRKSASTLPPLDALDTAWDLPEDDPTAHKDENPPSSSEMAGDSATGGDGIDEPGWD